MAELLKYLEDFLSLSLSKKYLIEKIEFRGKSIHGLLRGKSRIYQLKKDLIKAVNKKDLGFWIVIKAVECQNSFLSDSPESLKDFEIFESKNKMLHTVNISSILKDKFT